MPNSFDGGSATTDAALIPRSSNKVDAQTTGALQGMRERARKIGEQLQLWSRPEAGTEVELKVPVTTASRFLSTWLWRFRLHRPSRIDG